MYADAVFESRSETNIRGSLVNTFYYVLKMDFALEYGLSLKRPDLAKRTLEAMISLRQEQHGKTHTRIWAKPTKSLGAAISQ